MGKKENRVDQYILSAAPFAQPILIHLRELIHFACPEVEETMKWSMPHFEYKGILCSMAAFNHHCAFGFWKGSSLSDKHKIISQMGNTAMGSFGKITSLKDLPSDKIIVAYIKEAKKLNETKKPDEPKKVKKVYDKKDLIIPDDFLKALKKNKKANTTFQNYSYSHQKEYINWITEAKREETRINRIRKAILKLEEGKSKNSEYEK